MHCRARMRDVARTKPDRTHTALRVAAVVVLVAVGVWPRSRPATHAARVGGPHVDTAAEVTGAKRAPSAPRHVKLASATSDEWTETH